MRKQRSNFKMAEWVREEAHPPAINYDDAKE